MMARLAGMMKEGDKEMLERINTMINEKEIKSEENLTRSMRKTEERITEKFTTTIMEEDRKLEN